MPTGTIPRWALFINLNFKQMVKLNFSNPKEVIYTPDLAEDDEPGYTTEDFIVVCKGNVSFAEVVASLCEWQYPETVIDELEREDESEYQ